MREPSTFPEVENHVHVGTGLCRVCHHHGADCTGTLISDRAALDNLRKYFNAREVSADDWDFLFQTLEQTGRKVEDVP